MSTSLLRTSRTGYKLLPWKNRFPGTGIPSHSRNPARLSSLLSTFVLLSRAGGQSGDTLVNPSHKKTSPISSGAHRGYSESVEPYYTLRNVPSAGGRHALETYLLVNRVDSLDPGLYRYLAFSNRLLPIDTRPGLSDRTMAACFGQAFVRASAVTFIWSCVIYRMSWRYSERAYRLVHLDAGHVCQNLYLAGEQIGCGTCAIGLLMTC